MQGVTDVQAAFDEQVGECWGVGEEFPGFSGEGEVGDAGDGGWGAIAFAGKSGDEVPVHDDVAAVGVEVALGELHGLADHDAHGDGGDSFLVGCAKGVADVVAVVNEGLRREVGEARAEIVLALGTGVDDEPGAAEGVGYLYLFAYGVDEGLGRKGRTMPDVPMMEMPPVMPSLGLNVFRASSLPPGTEIRTETPDVT